MSSGDRVAGGDGVGVEVDGAVVGVGGVGEGVGDDDGAGVAACNVDARPKKAMASSMKRISYGVHCTRPD